MQNIENVFGVSLFNRTKNRIELNPVGEEAVKYARNLLDNTSQMITHVKTYERSLRTILIKSCAPAPLWTLIQNVSAKFPNMAVTSELDDMNGFNCLLKSEIGFWEDLCHIKMPASKFLVQTDNFEFLELANHSTLPFFTTNLGKVAEGLMRNRVEIPITDIESNVTYHIIVRKDTKLQI